MFPKPYTHQMEMKKKEYKNHMYRLQNIYKSEKSKRNVMGGVKSMDKLMKITHKMHSTANNFHKKSKERSLKQSTERSFLSKERPIKPLDLNRTTQNQFFFPKQNEKTRRQRQELENRNQEFLIRLMKVKPTVVCTNTSSSIQTNRFHNKSYQLCSHRRCDFTDILNSSQLESLKANQEPQKMVVRLNDQNNEALKIQFGQSLNSLVFKEKDYFFRIRSETKEIQSQCFKAVDIQSSTLCIHKKKDEKVLVELIQLCGYKQLSKGSLFFDSQQEMAGQQIKTFLISSKKGMDIQIHIEIKNLKDKRKKKLKNQMN